VTSRTAATVASRGAVVVLSLLLVSAASCSSKDSGTGADRLTGVTWVLDADSLDSLVDTPPADARIDLTFDAQKAHGTSGCNTYSGSYTVDGDGLTFGPLASTQMACDQPLMDLESAYLAALGDVTGFSVTVGKTLLLTGGGTDLSFSAETSLPLTGTVWRATSISSNNAVSSTIAGTEVTAEFGTYGTLSGSDGCNRYHAEYSTSGTSLTVGTIAGTLMACEPDVDQQAQDFRHAMESASAYEISGTSLTILDDSGNALLTFEGAA
jgi:heat shock protein HslJ